MIQRSYRDSTCRLVALAFLLLSCALRLVLPETATAAPPEAQEAVAQEAPPTFPAEVEQVVVDVVVTDKKGHPVSGLTADDLIVTEDGIRQRIVSFEAVELPEEPAAARSASPTAFPVSSNTAPEAGRARAFVVIFDGMNMTPFRARDAKGAVAGFLENGVRDGDYVTLISTAGATWWTAEMPKGRAKLIDIVKALEGRHVPELSRERITDWEAMQIHVHRDPLVLESVLRRFQTYGVVTQLEAGPETSLYGGPEDPFITTRAAEVYRQAAARIKATMQILERALNGLATAKGRKSVILVSEGFVHDQGLPEYRRVQEASRRANAAVYFVDARGLTGMPTSFTAQFGPPMQLQDIGFAMHESFEAAAGSERIASDTGGFTVRNTNDLETGIQKIADETRVYYLLGYIPTNSARDGQFREIEVELRKRRGRDVRARKGYYAPSDDGEKPLTPHKPGVDPVFQATLDSPWTVEGVPLRMTAYVGEEAEVGKATVVVVTEVDIRGFELGRIGDRYTGSLEILLVVVHGESGEYFQYDQTIDMNMLPATRERVTRTWLPIAREFSLRPGEHQAKMIVRERASGAVGSVTHDFAVPALGEFRVSTPILTDVVTQASAGPLPVLLARRTFPQGTELLCKFDVFGAAEDEQGMPHVVQGFEVRRLDGPAYATGPESVIGPTSLGALSRMIGVVLDEAVPGDYEIVLTLRDELSGKRLERREPFKVVPPAAPQSAGAGG